LLLRSTPDRRVTRSGVAPGCYHCQMGELEDAKRCVRQAVELDKSFQQMALDDANLESLWEELGRHGE